MNKEDNMTEKHELEVKRDSRLDFAKGVLIILVVLGHSFFPLEINGKNATDFYLHRFIYSFHMPAFMLLSGFFFYRSNSKSLKSVLISKIRSIGVPFLCFSCVIWALITIKSYLFSSETLSRNGFHLLQDLISFVLTSKVMWFLLSLLLNCFIVALLSRLSYGWVGYIMVILGSFFIPADHSYIYPGYLFMFPFFLTGYEIKKRNMSLFSLVGKSTIILILSCVALIGLFYFNKDTYIYHTGMNVLTDNPLYQIIVNVHRFVIGAIMSALFFTIIGWAYPKRVESRFVAKIIKLGTCSLGIYGFQQILIGVILRIIDMFNIMIPSTFVMVLINTSIVISLSYYLTQLCMSNKTLSMCFLGRY